ncbi:hypothetical protein BDV38DRAFT_244697 [Aspergillus pseudotamarii]|uniref:Uncharacterized protein n=1 Tax=Aspergillus pseudotamarii TaxID=132259 RepID=A0A5N6SUU6_ASPPS|nr:uncharacterized protein BDV38DRAFT_244697 [Aspergillus pseudotamarii]KAE8138456.1 hypothetical protein BDV38DRAFT_244697 [Aspergillus pseudotamarii]
MLLFGITNWLYCLYKYVQKHTNEKLDNVHTEFYYCKHILWVIIICIFPLDRAGVYPIFIFIIARNRTYTAKESMTHKTRRGRNKSNKRR